MLSLEKLQFSEIKKQMLIVKLLLKPKVREHILYANIVANKICK